MAMCQVCRRTLLAGERYRTWRWERRDQTVRVVDAYESVRVTGLTRTVRRVA